MKISFQRLLPPLGIFNLSPFVPLPFGFAQGRPLRFAREGGGFFEGLSRPGFPRGSPNPLIIALPYPLSLDGRGTKGEGEKLFLFPSL
jgi:hypothetical protein